MNVSSGLLLAALLLASRILEPWPESLFQIAVSLLAAVAIARWAPRKCELRFPPLMAALAAMALWGVLQIAFQTTMNAGLTRASTVRWATCAVVLFLASQKLGPWESPMLLFACAFAAASSAVFLATPGTDPPFGVFWNRNHYAAFAELLFPLALYRLLTNQGRIVAGAAAALLFSSVALSASRMGILLMGAEAAGVSLLVSRWNRKALLVTLALCLLAAGAARKRFAELVTRQPYEARFESASATLAMIREKPLTGFGLGTWQSVYPQFAPSDIGFTVLHSDNDWLEWTAEGGVPFLLLWIPVLYTAARRTRREPWKLGILAIAVHALTEFPLQKPALIYMTIAALAAETTAPALPASDRETPNSTDPDG